MSDGLSEHRRVHREFTTKLVRDLEADALALLDAYSRTPRSRVIRRYRIRRDLATNARLLCAHDDALAAYRQHVADHRARPA